MSRGVLDEPAHKAAVQAVEAAAKRGERVVGMTSIGGGRYSFETVKVERQSVSRIQSVETSIINRRGALAAEPADPQRSLL